MSELTLELGGMVLGRKSTLDVDGSNSHLPDHIPIEAPSSTCHLQTCLTILCAAIILLHANMDKTLAPPQESQSLINNELSKLYGP